MIMITILLFIFGTLFISYDVALIISCPGTFLDNVISFSHVWSAVGLYLIFVAVWRIKTKKSFWSVWKKWVKIAVSVCIAAGIIIGIVNLCFICNPKLANDEEPVDYVILLGGGIDKNGKLPDSVLNRVNRAASYMNAHKNTICVVTGGTLHFLPYPEAPEIKRQLVAAGIAEERILIEDKALDTIQNFKYSANLLCEHQNISLSELLQSKIAVVTNDFHLRRAERLATRMGFTHICGISAPTPAFKIPHSYLREIGAYIKLNLRILLTGEPKLLKN